MKGFHLIELLIVVAIIGVGASLAVPVYSDYFVKARRLEANAYLSKLALALEEYHLTHQTYQGATFANLNFPEWIVKDQYQLSMVVSDQEYTVSAIPKKDRQCGTLSLNSAGERK